MRALAFFGLLVMSVGCAHSNAPVQSAAPPQVLCPSNPVPKDWHDAQLCWVNAARDVNGNKLPATGPYSIKNTRIQRKQVGEEAKCNFDTPTQTLTVAPNVLAHLFKGLKENTKQCFRVRHVSLDPKGNELYGTWSNTAVKVIKPTGQLTVH